MRLECRVPAAADFVESTSSVSSPVPMRMTLTSAPITSAGGLEAVGRAVLHLGVSDGSRGAAP